MPEFDWDEANVRHIAEHNVSPEEAEQVLLSDPLELNVEHRGGEERVAELGSTTAGRILVVVSTPRNQRIRVVTAFEAPKQMKQRYLKERGGRHA